MPRAVRMLVVDDEPKICECLKSFFTLRGCVVETALSGQEAIEWLMEHPADVILLDIRLPDMAGTEVLRRAKELCPEAKVVMVTALDQDERRIEAQVYGAGGYVTKPFDLSDATWDSILSDLF